MKLTPPPGACHVYAENGEVLFEVTVGGDSWSVLLSPGIALQVSDVLHDTAQMLLEASPKPT